jgi:hypothetical protein
MRAIQFDPDALPDGSQRQWWHAWCRRADSARTKALLAWDAWAAASSRAADFRYAFNDNIWSDLKEWLATYVFRMKCAYCESPLEFDRYKGDAEHFRPKGSVTVVDAGGVRTRPRCTLPDGVEIEHPGYFWLAYDWRNLVPACSFCNSGTAKVDQFPAEAHLLFWELSDAERDSLPSDVQAELIPSTTWAGWFLPGPQSLDQMERPALLNPLNPATDRVPSQHLRYSLGGKVQALKDSQIGAASIRVYKLDRDELNKRRQQAQEQIHYAYFIEMASLAPDREARVDRALEPFRHGARDFSSAALDYLEEQLASLPPAR